MIKNTAKEPRFSWLFGGNPNEIERQELRGQQELTESKRKGILQLPSNYNGRDMTATELYESLGFQVIGQSEGDPIFLDVKVPEGWKVNPTDHSMWSHLVDPKGRVRAAIFYKAAFYDRSAHINSLEKRYSVIRKRFDRPDGMSFYEAENVKPIVFRAMEGETCLFETEEIFYTEKHSEGQHPDWWDGYNAMEKQCENTAKAWLSERFPDWQNPYAYWD